MTGKKALIISALVLACCLHAPRAHAKGSCGSGGATGELHDDWSPSEYYLFVPSDYVAGTRIPLLVVLHGDEGDPEGSILYYWTPIWRAHSDFIMLVPRAPYESGSWWRDVDGHETWLTSLIDDVLLDYNIDLDRIHLYGHSGGASFLGDFAIRHQDRYAAVGYCIGGTPAEPYVDPPSADCRIPARIVTGTEDTMLMLVEMLRDQLVGYGHEVDYLVQPGVGHDVTDECLNVMYDWLSVRTLCGTTRPDDCPGDPDPEPDLPPDMPPDASTDAPVDVIPADADDPPTEVPYYYDDTANCGCSIVA
jgi:predicted esterase